MILASIMPTSMTVAPTDRSISPTIRMIVMAMERMPVIAEYCAMLMKLADTLAVSVDSLLDRAGSSFTENYDAADSEYLRSLVSSPALRAILERVKDATPEEMAKAAAVLDALLG